MSDLIESLQAHIVHELPLQPIGVRKVLDTIEQQQAEIERLTALRKEDREDMQRLSDQIDYLSDENAKLQAVVDAALKQDNPCDELIEALAALEDNDGL